MKKFATLIIAAILASQCLSDEGCPTIEEGLCTNGSTVSVTYSCSNQGSNCCWKKTVVRLCQTVFWPEPEYVPLEFEFQYQGINKKCSTTPGAPCILIVPEPGDPGGPPNP